jgi:hypothetical protein
MKPILRRIEACIALGASFNDHEAVLAIGRARLLMTAYGVTADELTAAARAALAEGERFAMLPTAATLDAAYQAVEMAERGAKHQRARAALLYGKRKRR